MDNKNDFINDYVLKLEDAIAAYNLRSDAFIKEKEEELYSVIRETCIVLETIIPNISDSLNKTNGFALEDARILIGKIRLHLINVNNNSNISTNNSFIKVVEPQKSQNNKIFISHRTTDEKIAKLIARFLIDCGAPRDSVFVSSLPGNDVNFEISKEVKENLHASSLNIVLLSSDYYKSAYCQNEAGIIWYLDIPKVVIALPEITTQNMQGFLNSENKIRRLDNKDDMLSLAKLVEEKYLNNPISPVMLNRYVDDLIEDYNTALKTRTTVQTIKSHNVIYPNKYGIYTTTIIEERDTKNSKYRCLKIDGILPTGEPYKNDETHWLLLDSSVYSDVSIGDKVTFVVSSICPLRDFSDLKHTRNIYVNQLLVI